LEEAEARRELNTLYTQLSLSVHEHPEKTTVGRVIMEGGELFEEPQPLRESLEEFMRLISRVMDIGTVLTLNILRTKRDPDEVRRILSRLKHEYDLDKLPSYHLTRKAVKQLDCV
jgi:hypothetical protein